ncbi:FG-GAP-like repeat-containing protein [Lentzea sp. JNUCC 0626]|uniref:FG-GAP-like repeat-containing protein n=1 Tax=Lentzea sp. JNUCC 0626 TaxID=3367513 RepID=UPI00374A57CB
MKKSGIRMMAAAIAMAAGALLIAPPAQAAPSRDRIVDVATGQIGGSACNPGYFNSCGMAWCAEFARWVWDRAGVEDIKGLDGWAQSFKTYGTKRGLYHSRSSGYKPQPGDAIVFDWDHNSGDDHPIDHVAIVTSSTSSRVYTIGGNQGDASRVTRANYSLSNGDIDGYISPAGVGSGGGGPEEKAGHSVTGDSYHDLVARKTDGTLWLYANNIIRDNGDAYSATRQIGQGWGNLDIIPADVTGDGFTDLVTRRTDGTLWLYANNYVRDNGDAYSASRQIGQGWNVFDKIIGADVTGDGFTDLVGRKPDGTLWLYANNFVRDNGDAYSAGRQIGQGWNGFNEILGADVTGDGFTDLVARRTDGTLWLYANNIIRDNGDAYSASRQIGQGWGNLDIIPADVTGDGFTDLVARRTDGTLWLYANNYVRDNGDAYSASRQIGQGWNGFNKIV